MSYNFDWFILIEYKSLIFSGLLLTCKLALLAIIFSFFIGSFIGIARLSNNWIIRGFATVFVEIFRNIPLIVIIFYFYFAINLDSFWAGLMGVTCYSSSFIAEVVRSGIQSIHSGQVDAGKSTGLGRFQIMRHIVVPQGFLIIVPALGNEFMRIIKNTSYAMTVGVAELTFQTSEIDSLTFRGFEASTAVTLLYLCLSIIMVICIRITERIIDVEKRIG
jgi:polar amino acid transport system permease protein